MSDDQVSSGLDSLFTHEAEGVHIQPGPQKGQIVIDFIQDHLIHGAIFENKTYFDFIRYGALEWLYNSRNELKSKVSALAEIELENIRLKEEISLLRQKLFGSSSDNIPPAEPQKPTLSGNTQEPDSIAPQQPKPRPTQNAGRKPLPPHLPRERRVYDIPVNERFCPCCHGAIHPIGEEVTEQLTVIPAQYKVIQHARKKFTCRNCGRFVTAPGHKPLIEKSSYASPEFLAHVACSRYQFGLPFYRQEQIFLQSGLPFNRTTLANLMIGCADKLSALHEVLRTELLRQPIIHADETHVQVLKETERSPQTRSYLWLYRSSQEADRPIVLFEYQMTRSGEHPRRFLGVNNESPFTGYLQVDGYAGYNNLPGITRVGCMAHVRRKFVDVIKGLPSQATNSPAHYAERLIGKLYEVERKTNGTPARVRHKVRQEESVPLLLELKALLEKLKPDVTPKTALGRAIGYAQDQWTVVTRYVDDGRLAIDNNIAEREIKQVVIGRKNWLFADSMDGMHANAVMYSLIQTAKANGIDPFAYLRYVITTMPTLRSASEMHVLLPWSMPMQTRGCNLRAA